MRRSRGLVSLVLPLALACGAGFAARGAEAEKKLTRTEVPAPRILLEPIGGRARFRRPRRDGRPRRRSRG